MRTASFASAADFLARSAAARIDFCVFTSLQWSVPARQGVAIRACVPAWSSAIVQRRARMPAPPPYCRYCRYRHRCGRLMGCPNRLGLASTPISTLWQRPHAARTVPAVDCGGRREAVDE